MPIIWFRLADLIMGLLQMLAKCKDSRRCNSWHSSISNPLSSKRIWPRCTAGLLTTEGVVAPGDGHALLGAVAGVGSEDRTVTRPLLLTAAHLRLAEPQVRLPLHHVMTRLQGPQGEGPQVTITPLINHLLLLGPPMEKTMRPWLYPNT